MKIYDNIQEIVKDDMATTISKGSKISIAAACFSMYAYKELKKQLDSACEFRFISNITGENMGGFMTVDNLAEQVAYMPMGGFTTVDIGCERGNNSYNMVNRMEAPFATQ